MRVQKSVVPRTGRGKGPRAEAGILTIAAQRGWKA